MDLEVQHTGQPNSEISASCPCLPERKRNTCSTAHRPAGGEPQGAGLLAGRVMWHVHRASCLEVGMIGGGVRTGSNPESPGSPPFALTPANIFIASVACVHWFDSYLFVDQLPLGSYHSINCTEGHKVGRMNPVLNHTFQHHIKMNKSHQTTSRPKVLSFLTNLLATESSCPQPKIWKQCYGNVPAIAESLAAEGGEHHPSAFALHTVVFCTKVISSLKIKFKKGEREKNGCHQWKAEHYSDRNYAMQIKAKNKTDLNEAKWVKISVSCCRCFMKMAARCSAKPWQRSMLSTPSSCNRSKEQIM